jgi:hypothetical protein
MALRAQSVLLLLFVVQCDCGLRKRRCGRALFEHEGSSRVREVAFDWGVELHHCCMSSPVVANAQLKFSLHVGQSYIASGNRSHVSNTSVLQTFDFKVAFCVVEATGVDLQ